MLMGPSSTTAQQTEFAEKIRDNPRTYIAQPVITLSTCPTWTEEGAARDTSILRPYIITSHFHLGVTRRTDADAGTTKGSLVVNSSQGGGSKEIRGFWRSDFRVKCKLSVNCFL